MGHLYDTNLYAIDFEAMIANEWAIDQAIDSEKKPTKNHLNNSHFMYFSQLSSLSTGFRYIPMGANCASLISDLCYRNDIFPLNQTYPYYTTEVSPMQEIDFQK